jgi:hypothetical protein
LQWPASLVARPVGPQAASRRPLGGRITAARGLCNGGESLHCSLHQANTTRHQQQVAAAGDPPLAVTSSAIQADEVTARSWRADIETENRCSRSHHISTHVTSQAPLRAGWTSGSAWLVGTNQPGNALPQSTVHSPQFSPQPALGTPGHTANDGRQHWCTSMNAGGRRPGWTRGRLDSSHY